jgi:hypothetical protein
VHAHPPFITFTITSKVAVYAPAEWADTLTLFHLYSKNMYSVIPTVCEPLLVEEVESGEYLPAQAADVIQLKPLPPPCTKPN